MTFDNKERTMKANKGREEK